MGVRGPEPHHPKRADEARWEALVLPIPSCRLFCHIRIVERSHLPAKQTLDRLGIAQPTFYRWYDLYQRFGEEVLQDKRPGPRRAWNLIPDDVRGQILDMALERTDLSPRELAVTFTDTKSYFVSEAGV